MKKTLCGALAVLMALCVLTGCGGNQGEEPQAPEMPDAPSVSAAPEREPEPAAPEEPEQPAAQSSPQEEQAAPQPEEPEPPQEPEFVEDLDEDGEARLLALFQRVYDASQVKSEAGAFPTLEDQVAYELRQLPQLAEEDDASLPEDFAEFYLSWRPGGIGELQLPAEGEQFPLGDSESPESGEVPEEGETAEEPQPPSHDIGWEPGLG